MVQLSETFLMESQSLDKDHQKLVEMVNEITQMEKGLDASTGGLFLLGFLSSFM